MDAQTHATTATRSQPPQWIGSMPDLASPPAGDFAVLSSVRDPLLRRSPGAKWAGNLLLDLKGDEPFIHVVCPTHLIEDMLVAVRQRAKQCGNPLVFIRVSWLGDPDKSPTLMGALGDEQVDRWRRDANSAVLRGDKKQRIPTVMVWFEHAYESWPASQRWMVSMPDPLTLQWRHAAYRHNLARLERQDDSPEGAIAFSAAVRRALYLSVPEVVGYPYPELTDRTSGGPVDDVMELNPPTSCFKAITAAGLEPRVFALNAENGPVTMEAVEATFDEMDALELDVALLVHRGAPDLQMREQVAQRCRAERLVVAILSGAELADMVRAGYTYGFDANEQILLERWREALPVVQLLEHRA